MGSFSQALREIRMKRGLTQGQLAEILGTKKQVVSRYETGVTSPTLSTMQAWAEKLGVPTERLLKTEEEMRAMITPQMLADAGGDLEEAFNYAVLMGDVRVDAPSESSRADIDRLEALHQNPRLGMLFDRSRDMSDDQIEQVLRFANFILQEREDKGEQ